jgi:hypothetical protein
MRQEVAMRKFAVFCFIIVLAGHAALAQGAKTRIFITDSKSWELSGGFGVGIDAAAGGISGGARPQTAEIMKTFRERCPMLIVTLRQEAADYIILLDHEGGKEFVRRDNKVAVFDRNGDMLYSGSTRTLGNAVKDACEALARHRGGNP